MSTQQSSGNTHNSTARAVRDVFGRPLRDLRISVTDRCNFRCKYCMPKEVFGPDFAFLERNELLTFEEITRTVQAFAACGVRKIRLTGGEPLLRRNLEGLIEQISAIPGVDDICLTTNGSQLTKAKAKALKLAGLHRITISLDSLDDAVFQSMNDVHFPVAKVLEAIDIASEAGLSPVKINMVVKRGVNDHSVLEMARRFRGSGCTLRFIEFMDVGNSNGWRMDQVVPSKEIYTQIHEQWPLEKVDPAARGEVAVRYRYADGQGEVGFISSVTQAFCADCTRIRLSPEGRLYTCLFGTQGFDLRQKLRDGATEEELKQMIQSVWGARTDRYSEIRSEQTRRQGKVEMSHIGG